MCTSDRVESHTGSKRAGRRGYVARLILNYKDQEVNTDWQIHIDDRGRAGAGYTIHERSRGQYWLTAKHVLIGCGRGEMARVILYTKDQ